MHVHVPSLSGAYLEPLWPSVALFVARIPAGIVRTKSATDSQRVNCPGPSPAAGSASEIGMVDELAFQFICLTCAFWKNLGTFKKW